MKKQFYKLRRGEHLSVRRWHCFRAALLVFASQSTVSGANDDRIGEESGAAGVEELRLDRSLPESRGAVAPASLGRYWRGLHRSRMVKPLEPGPGYTGGNGYFFGLLSATSRTPQPAFIGAAYPDMKELVVSDGGGASTSHDAHSSDCIVDKPGPAVWAW